MSSVALGAVNVAKRYARGPLALNGIDLAIVEGTITGLVGPNGAGKSTLIKAWIGFERPSQGEVRVFQSDPWRDRSGALRNIGYVPQTPSLYLTLTVRDHLSLAASARKRFDRDLARARLDQLGISVSSLCGNLSGGQQAQVSLALALGTRAPVLLLDEPLAHLDPLARREFLHVLVEDVRANGITALLTSHVVTDIAQSCSHLVVLGTGQKLLDDGIAGAIARHRVATGRVDAAGVVASFPDSAGRVVTLIESTTAGRPATLEEVVFGYLASVRDHIRVKASRAVVADSHDATAETSIVAFDADLAEPVVIRTGTPVAKILTSIAAGVSPSETADQLDLSLDEVNAGLTYAATVLRQTARSVP